MIEELLKQFAQENTFRHPYEEGRDLLHRVLNKISDKYKLGIVCMATRGDQDTQSLDIMRVSKEQYASMLVSLLTDAKLAHDACALIPQHVWIRVNKYSWLDKLLLIFGGGVCAIAGSYLLKVIGG